MELNHRSSLSIALGRIYACKNMQGRVGLYRRRPNSLSLFYGSIHAVIWANMWPPMWWSVYKNFCFFYILRIYTAKSENWACLDIKLDQAIWSFQYDCCSVKMEQWFNYYLLFRTNPINRRDWVESGWWPALKWWNWAFCINSLLNPRMFILKRKCDYSFMVHHTGTIKCIEIMPWMHSLITK